VDGRSGSAGNRQLLDKRVLADSSLIWVIGDLLQVRTFWTDATGKVRLVGIGRSGKVPIWMSDDSATFPTSPQQTPLSRICRLPAAWQPLPGSRTVTIWPWHTGRNRVPVDFAVKRSADSAELTHVPTTTNPTELLNFLGRLRKAMIVASRQARRGKSFPTSFAGDCPRAGILAASVTSTEASERGSQFRESVPETVSNASTGTLDRRWPSSATIQRFRPLFEDYCRQRRMIVPCFCASQLTQSSLGAPLPSSYPITFFRRDSVRMNKSRSLNEQASANLLCSDQSPLPAFTSIHRLVTEIADRAAMASSSCWRIVAGRE
jgi:hypothetical protein